MIAGVVVLMLAVVLVTLAVMVTLKHTTNKQVRYSHVQSMAALITIGCGPLIPISILACPCPQALQSF